MPIDPKDFERALATAGAEPVSFDVWYGEKLVQYTADNKSRINLDAATRLTIQFPFRSRGKLYLGNGEWADKNRVKVRKKR